jgi:uncharacterized protein YkwD
MSRIRSGLKKIKKLFRLKNNGHKSSSPPRQEFLPNHAHVNWERKRRGLRPLKRSRFLDEVAREHADRMALQTKVFHSVNSLSQLRCKLNSNRAGENTISGSSNDKMMRILMVGVGTAKENPNILNNDFVEFGMACVRGSDGLFYLVQYFRGHERVGFTLDTKSAGLSQ